jgi:hypothetical protein
MLLDGRHRAVWLVIFETGRAPALVMLERERAIYDGAIYPELERGVVGEIQFAVPRGCSPRD